MRPILAVLCAVTILGGLKIYMSTRPKPVAFQAKSAIQAAGQFDVEITLTFDAGPDTFAFDASDATSLSVSFLGKQIIRRVDTVPAGEPIVLSSLQGVLAGRNEFFVEAFPQDTDSLIARALRVRIFLDGTPIGDESLWSEPGEPIAGTIMVETAAVISRDEHRSNSSETSSEK